MIFREAQISDIPQMKNVRNSVKENALSNPALITDNDYNEYLFHRGKGWVCVIDDAIVGLAIVDMIDHNVWALFIQPGFEGKGIGRKLHDNMLNWYFDNCDVTLWLGTSPNTRAEKFYRTSGWREVGVHGKGEIKFEMTATDWESLRSGLNLSR